MHNVAAYVCVPALMSNPAWTEAAGESLKPSLSGEGKCCSTEQDEHTR